VFPASTIQCRSIQISLNANGPVYTISVAPFDGQTSIIGSARRCTTTASPTDIMKIAHCPYSTHYPLDPIVHVHSFQTRSPSSFEPTAMRLPFVSWCVDAFPVNMPIERTVRQGRILASTVEDFGGKLKKTF